MGKVVFMGFKGFLLRVAEIEKNGRKRSNFLMLLSYSEWTFGTSD